MSARLHIERTVDDFGHGLTSEPYWRAEVRDPDWSTWRCSFRTWREALHRGLAELARRA